MNQDINTTTIINNTLLTNKKTSVTNGASITSGKINPIVDQKELDLISGGRMRSLKEMYNNGWCQMWGRGSF